MSAMQNNNGMLAVILVIGAVWYSKQAKAGTTGLAYRPPLGTGSMPANSGSGAAQVIGGALGSLFQNMFMPKNQGQSSIPVVPPGYKVDLGGGDWMYGITPVADTPQIIQERVNEDIFRQFEYDSGY